GQNWVVTISWSYNDTIKKSYSWAKHFVSYGKGLTSLNQFLTSCTNWTGFKVYLNTDGSVKYENGSVAARGIAELWGLLDGLGILMDRGYDHVLIQTDNLEAIKAIQESPIGGSSSTLIRKIL
ncbi:hypothetical protein Gohar_021894, partial [Gossypium harknessii]|nr:hypothetical protein [Gossypium harknessii]